STICDLARSLRLRLLRTGSGQRPCGPSKDPAMYVYSPSHAVCEKGAEDSQVGEAKGQTGGEGRTGERPARARRPTGRAGGAGQEGRGRGRGGPLAVRSADARRD